MKGSKVVALGATLAFLATAIIPVSAGTHTLTLTNTAGCGTGSGAYGQSSVVWDLTWSIASVRTVGNQSTGCSIRYLYKAQMYYGGSVHEWFHHSYTYDQNIIYSSYDTWPSWAKGQTHKICGAGPVCGTGKDTYTTN